MSPAEPMNWNWIELFVMLAFTWTGVLVVWLYAHSTAQLRLSRRSRLDELQESLYIYGELAGALACVREGSRRGEPNSSLVRALEKAKAAPYLTPYLQEEIQDCLEQADSSHISLLHRSIEREMNKLIDERRMLLQETHAPGWGTAWWSMLRPALGPAALIGILWLIWRMLRQWLTLEDTATPWEHSLLWMQLLSGLLAILCVYRLLSLRRQNGLDVTASHIPASIVSFLIAGMALLQWLGLGASPYILAAQLLMFALGFRFTRGRSRSNRPYAGQSDEDPETPKGTSTDAGNTSQ
ncbi:hypothetical protein [Paenibacillus massiliensis]|uniref:hypothetical protein n=1 Tax=Paenibacillus massiliensis TaxID=225917 RepID=UPI0004705A3D|nr:hypothetical protein [Paenibacillus massiliensis]